MSAADLKVTQRSFNFGKKHGLPFYFVSAADGTNVVKVRGQKVKHTISFDSRVDTAPLISRRIKFIPSLFHYTLTNVITGGLSQLNRPDSLLVLSVISLFP